METNYKFENFKRDFKSKLCLDANFMGLDKNYENIEDVPEILKKVSRTVESARKSKIVKTAGISARDVDGMINFKEWTNVFANQIYQINTAAHDWDAEILEKEADDMLQKLYLAVG